MNKYVLFGEESVEIWRQENAVRGTLVRITLLFLEISTLYAYRQWIGRRTMHVNAGMCHYDPR